MEDLAKGIGTVGIWVAFSGIAILGGLDSDCICNIGFLVLVGTVFMWMS